MFWLVRARPYQRTKRREPPGARDGPIGRGVVVGWPGGAVELWSENAKTGRRRVRDIRARLFETAARRPVSRGRGVATDAVQMPEARCPLRGSLRDTVLGSCVTLTPRNRQR